jgi:hypothetical protein
MPPHVEITFDCVPLRSVDRAEPPDDSSPRFRALFQRVRRAAEKHGRHNTYYLHNARCVFRLTNDPRVGTLEFRFEGTVLADSEDRKALDADLEIQLSGETCDWLTEPAVAWLVEAVRRAVIVEFDRFAAAGDLQRTIDRMARVEAESDAHGGFLGMGL